MGNLATGSGTIRSQEARDDSLNYYQTPKEAVHALIENFPIPLTIYEPACGAGAIVDILRCAGRTVHASDVIDRGCPDSKVGDFLEGKEAIPGVECVITNPPFSLGHEFVRKSRELYPLTIMLLRLAFLESVRRTDILDAGDLAQVLLFKNRLPFMHREGYTGKKNSNSGMPFAWFIWDQKHKGPPLLRRISWEKTRPVEPTPLETYIANN